MTYKPSKDAPLSAFGDSRSTELSPILQGIFEYTVDNILLNTNTVTGSGSVTNGESMAVLSSGISLGSTALLRSFQHARYSAGFGGLSRFTALFDTPEDDTEQLIGIAGDLGSNASFKDGFMLGYIGLVFGFHRFRDDELFSVPLSEWDDTLNGLGASGINIDQTKLNVFGIQFEELGGGPINIFMQDDDTPDFVKVHTVNYSNINLAPSSFNPNFFHTMWVNNGSVSSDISLKSSSYGFFIEGKEKLLKIYQPIFSSGTRVTENVTSEIALMTIRNKSIYINKTNYINVQLFQFMMSIMDLANPTNQANIRFVFDATLTGSVDFVDVVTNSSVMEVDAGGQTVSGGFELQTIPLFERGDRFSFDVDRFEVLLNPGRAITITGVSEQAATMSASALWKELF